MEAEERAKRRDYTRTWPDPLPRIVPLIATTTGRIGPQAQRFFLRTVRRAVTRDARMLWHGHLSVRQTPVFWRRRISVTLAVVTALMLHRRLQYAFVGQAAQVQQRAAGPSVLPLCQLPSFYRAAPTAAVLPPPDAPEFCGDGFRRGVARAW